MNSCLIDTNILLRIAQPASQQHLKAVQAVEELKRRKTRLVLVPQVVYEYWTVATRPVEVNGLGMNATLIQKSVTLLLEEFTLLKDERGIFNLWHQLVTENEVSGKKTHDVRLVAAMKRHGIEGLLTYNIVDFRRYEPILVIDPDDLSE